MDRYLLNSTVSWGAIIAGGFVAAAVTLIVAAFGVGAGLAVAQSAWNEGAIDLIPIADEVARRLIPGECLGYLACDPFSRRVCCDVDPDQVSAVWSNDDEGIEQVEAKGRDNEQIHMAAMFGA